MGAFNTKNVVESFINATQVKDVWEELLDCTQSIGFANVLYGFTRFHTSSGFGDNNDHLILTNFGPEYMRGYFDEGRFENGPMVRWALNNEGACSWRWIAEEYDTLSPEEKDVVAFNRAHGVVAGYTVGYRHSLKRAKAAIGFSLEPFQGSQNDADEIWNAYGRDLMIIAGVAHLKILSLPIPKQMLTKRQREVLEWVADGKTVMDTAQILGLNRATVEKHLRLAREALGVDTTPQAVLKASFHNQIYTF